MAALTAAQMEQVSRDRHLNCFHNNSYPAARPSCVALSGSMHCCRYPWLLPPAPASLLSGPQRATSIDIGTD